MANLFGSLLAGAMTGGAAANLVELRAQAEEERKMSFAKIQQQYAKENAEFVNSLGMARDDRNFSRNQAADLGKEIRGRQYKDEDRVTGNEDAEIKAVADQGRAQENAKLASGLSQGNAIALAKFGVDNRAPSATAENQQLLKGLLEGGKITPEEYKSAVLGKTAGWTQKNEADALTDGYKQAVAETKEDMKFQELPQEKKQEFYDKRARQLAASYAGRAGGGGPTDKATYVPGTILEINGKPYKVNPDGKTMSPAAPAATQKSKMSPEDQAWSDGAAQRAEDEDIRNKAAKAAAKEAALNENISIF